MDEQERKDLQDNMRGLLEHVLSPEYVDLDVALMDCDELIYHLQAIRARIHKTIKQQRFSGKPTNKK